MGKRNAQVDAYIARSPEFARIILAHLRNLVHRSCPEASETIKWGFPHFEYKGILCSMAAFKQHCALSFWKAALLSDRRYVLSRVGRTGMGQFGRLKSLSDLPPDSMIRSCIKEAMDLNEKGTKVPARGSRTRTKTPLPVPPDLKRALTRNAKALKTFERFSASHRREYIEWITTAKTEVTRMKRLETAIQYMAQGKVRNWKYLRK